MQNSVILVACQDSAELQKISLTRRMSDFIGNISFMIVLKQYATGNVGLPTSASALFMSPRCRSSVSSNPPF